MGHSGALRKKRLQIDGYRHKKGYTCPVTETTDWIFKCNREKSLRHNGKLEKLQSYT